MEIKVINNEDIKIVEIIGQLNGINSEKAEKEISALLIKNSRLVFEMSQCDYISSAGLRVLLITAKKLKLNDGHAVTCGLIEEVKDVMEMTGFDNMFNNYENLEEAVEAIKKEV